MVTGSKVTSYAFSEGEKVLCYEPDPSKAKVLYESKILEIRLPSSQRKVSTTERSNGETSTKETPKSESRGPSPNEKDSIGKDESDSNNSGAKARYLVHFSGWNSSWDRVVDEERILKDTPANRALQRSLAEEAGTLLSKSRNRNRSKMPPMIKEVINSSSQDGSYSIEFTADDFDLAPVASDVDEDESTSGSLTASFDKASNLDKNLPCDRNSASDRNVGSEKCLAPTKDVNQSMKEDLSIIQWIRMPNQLKEVLDADQELILHNNYLYKLPMTPSIFEILQSFIDIVMNGNPNELFPNLNTKRSGVTRSSVQSVSRLYQDLQQLVPEFANSIDIYVNAIAQTHLFYSDTEKEHFLRVVSEDAHMETNQMEVESGAKNQGAKESRDRPKSSKPSSILGFIHLLRFLVILPDFIKATPTMTRAHAHQIMTIIEPFYHYLCNKIDTFHSVE